LYGLFNGTHQFYFNPSQTNPGNTTFVQKEDFTGPLAFVMREGWSPYEATRKVFEAFNKDIKEEVEKTSS
jgi:hypothetical protein